MKYVLAVFIISLSFFYSEAQIVNIPDPDLKLVLTSFNCVDLDNNGVPDADADTNDDGEIQVSEAEAVEYLILGGVILDLTGLEAFVNLRSFNAENADFYDISYVGGNYQYSGVGILDLTFMQNIERIFLSGESLTGVNLSGLTNLVELQLFSVGYADDQGAGGQATPVNLQGCTSLLDLNMMNALLDIDFCQVPTLEELNSFALDPSVGPIDLDLNCLTNLKILDVGENQFNTLYLKNNSVLESFYGGAAYGNVLCIDDNQAELDSLGDFVDSFQTVTTSCGNSSGTNSISGDIMRTISFTSNTCTGNNDFMNPLRFNVSQNNATVTNFLAVSANYYEVPEGLGQGEYIVTPTVNFSDGYVVTPEQFTVNFAADNGEIFEQDLCLNPRVETTGAIEIRFFPYYYPTELDVNRFDAYLVLNNTSDDDMTVDLRLNYDDNYTFPFDYNEFPNSEGNGDTIWNNLTVNANSTRSLWLRIGYNSDTHPNYPVMDGDQLIYDVYLTIQGNPSTQSSNGGGTTPDFRLIQTINPGEEVLYTPTFEELDTEVKVYPNPTKDLIFLDYSNDIETLTLYNINGQLVKTITNFESEPLDLSDLKNGVYFLSIKTENSVVTKKIIKH